MGAFGRVRRALARWRVRVAEAEHPGATRCAQATAPATALGGEPAPPDRARPPSPRSGRSRRHRWERGASGATPEGYPRGLAGLGAETAAGGRKSRPFAATGISASIAQGVAAPSAAREKTRRAPGQGRIEQGWE